jgi:predicted amidohydrolase YtcJ
MLQEGAANLVSRLLPEATEEDWDQALRAAQAHLLSLGITGWQDAIIGRGRGHDMADPMGAYLRAARAGTLVTNVVGALWWDRQRGLEQLPELLQMRADGQGGRFRATSVKMMLDGVAENHTAAMLEPYLDGDGCATGHAGLDFIDPGELPRFVAARSAAPWTPWPRPGRRTASTGGAITSRTFRSCIPTTSRGLPGCRPPPTCSRSGRRTSRRWMS